MNEVHSPGPDHSAGSADPARTGGLAAPVRPAHSTHSRKAAFRDGGSGLRCLDHSARSRRLWAAVIALIFLMFCSVLRAPISVVSALLTTIGQDAALTPFQLGVLSSIPVFCFGALMPFASLIVGKIGVNSAGIASMLLMIAGSLLRSAPGTILLFLGTFILGVGMTIGNLVAPMIIGRDFWRHTALMTGLYSGMANLFVTLGTALAVPTAQLTGWRGAAALWGALPPALALALWLWVYPSGRSHPRQTLLHRASWRALIHESRSAQHASPPGRSVWLRGSSWVLVGALAGHLFAYYAVASWLPTMLTDLAGMSDAEAGLASSVFSLTGIVGPLLVPLFLVGWHWSERTTLLVISACWFALPAALLLAPSAWLVASIFSGIAQGAFFAGLFTLVIHRSASVDENRRQTAMLHTCGYLLGAPGPIIVGWFSEAAGGWVGPLLLVLAVLAIMTLCSAWATRAPKETTQEAASSSDSAAMEQGRRDGIAQAPGEMDPAAIQGKGGMAGGVSGIDSTPGEKA